MHAMATVMAPRGPQVADDEARHFSLLASRLEALGSSYGDLPAHDGLWESACATAGSLPARLAVEHCVHEARGLDVLPSTIAKFRNNGDDESAALLEGVIYPEEVTHCGAGVRWLTHLHAAAHAAPEEKEEGGVSGPSGGVSWPTESASLAAEALSSISSISSSASSSDWRVDARRHATVEAWFHALARAHFRGPLKPPFNEEARDRAGFTKGWYMPLAAAGGGGGEDQSQQEQNESTGLRPDADRSSNDAASGGRRASASAGGAGAAGTADKAAVEFASLAVAGQA